MTKTFPPLSEECAELLLDRIDSLLQKQKPVILGIDGRCGSGKTTLAASLAGKYDAYVIHMDDYFLPFGMRTPKRLGEPGGNVHYERFSEELYHPLKSFRDAPRPEPLKASPAPEPIACYRAFSCRDGSLSEPKPVFPHPLIIIEGSYCMRPEIRDLYDLKLFLDISRPLQSKRLAERPGTRMEDFLGKWIPLEERYFSTGIAQACDLTLTVCED